MGIYLGSPTEDRVKEGGECEESAKVDDSSFTPWHRNDANNFPAWGGRRGWKIAKSALRVEFE